MLGYAANIRVAVFTYNAVHTYVGPLVLAGHSFGSNRPAMVSLSSSGSLTSALIECLDSG